MSAGTSNQAPTRGEQHRSSGHDPRTRTASLSVPYAACWGHLTDRLGDFCLHRTARHRPEADRAKSHSRRARTATTPADGNGRTHVDVLSLIHISEPTRLGMISYAVFCLK